MRINIILKDKKQFFKVSKTNWYNYLNHVSKGRNTDNNISLCGVKNNNLIWCYSCNKTPEFWNNSCVNTISHENFRKYISILYEKNTDNDFYEIEIKTKDSS
jgi:hypothetical protein